MTAQAGKKTQSVLYGCVDETLFWDILDSEEVMLTRRGSLKLAAKIQFAARSENGRFLYAVVSDAGAGVTGAAGSLHGLQAMAISPKDGGLSAIGTLYPLPERPIHISIAESGHYAAVAFNKSGQVRIYRLAEDGTVACEVEQAEPLKAGIFTHQALFSPDQYHILAVARGNEPRDGKQEERGTLAAFSFSPEDGRAAPEKSTMFLPGMGPRHFVLHPDNGMAYLAIERGSMVFTYHMKDGIPEETPVFQTEALLDLTNRTVPRQRGGVGVIHPQGKFLYVSNRADKTEVRDGQGYLLAGENNIAVFALDETTGEPRLLEHCECHGVEPRNLTIDPTGTVFIAANQKTMYVPEAGGWRLEPANLALFRIAPDGRLFFVRRYDLHEQGHWLLWTEVYGMEI